MQRLTLMLVFGFGLICSTAFCQDERPSPFDPSAQTQTFDIQQPNQLQQFERVRTADGNFAMRPVDRNPNSVANLMKKYKQAEEASDKEDIVDELRKQLKEAYDASLASHEKNLEQMEAKLKKLREQLDKRRAAKNKIVDLRIEVLVNEAEGLGWPDKRSSRFFNSTNLDFGNINGQNQFPGPAVRSPAWKMQEVATPPRPAARTPKATRPTRSSR